MRNTRQSQHCQLLLQMADDAILLLTQFDVWQKIYGNYELERIQE